jgi:hypothetical protein
MDGCALVSTTAGWNLAIGASPRATGRFETLRASDGCPIVTGQVQQDRCWMHEGLGWITADPERWLHLIPKKLGHTFDHESFPMGYLGEADPAAWPEPRKARGRALLTGAHAALLVLAALGLVARPSRRLLAGRVSARDLVQLGALLAVVALGLLAIFDVSHPLWPIAVVIPALALLPAAPGGARSRGVIGYVAFTIATVCITHAVFFGEDRYHMVTTPAFCILAACALRAAQGGEPGVETASETQRG